MRFLILNTDYPQFLAQFYAENTGLAEESFERQMSDRMETMFGVADFYSQGLRKLGHLAVDVHANNGHAQQVWGREHGITFAPCDSTPRELFPWICRMERGKWQYEVLAAQIKHYRPDETTANTTVSYYLKGSVVGFLLDLELRRRSAGKRSLDDLVRFLFERHGRAPGLPEEGVEKAALDLVPDLAPWFERAVRSTQELELDAALAGVGLRAVVRAATGPDDKGGAEQEPKPAATNGGPRSWFGAQVKDKGGALEVQSVVEGSPAQQAGIGGGDEIVAIDGFRTDLKQRLGRALPGQQLRVTLFRMDELLELRVQLAPAPRDTVVLVPDEAASGEAKHLRTAWLGGRWPEAQG